jgi:outer membrane lipoprotein-sorting protein
LPQWWVVVMSKNGLRWLPAAVVPVVIAVGALAVPWQAGAAVDLPEKSPQEVLELAANSSVEALSGTIEQSSNLGLPELPQTMDDSAPGADGFLELLTGSHSARVYLDGPDKARLQVKDRLGERDLVLNGTDAWFYDFDQNAAIHATLPQHSESESHSNDGTVGTPEQLAEHFLEAVEPSTDVALGSNVSIAGRTAYTLLLTPRASETLTDSVSIAVDSATGLPLGVEVLARGQEQPAFEVAFTELSFETPDASRFSFVPPAGAEVTEQVIPDPTQEMPVVPEGEFAPMPGLQPTVVGEGWDAVLVLPAAAVPADVADSPLFGELTRRVDGGQLLSSALLNVLMTDDGRVLVGSVPAGRLQTVAGQ